jgi:hypothetical protein
MMPSTHLFSNYSTIELLMSQATKRLSFAVGHKKHFKALSAVHFRVLKHYFSYSPVMELKGSAHLIPKSVK